MAQQDPWRDWLDQNNTGTTGGRAVDTTVQPDANAFDLKGFYQQTLGRDPNQNEFDTDTANIAKYGVPGFQSDFQKRVGPRQPAAGPQTQPLNIPGLQFDDPYTNLLEQISQKQLGEVRSNPGLDQLMQFLTSQFQDLSTNPGYNADERALLNTQAFEPIEANRAASKQRAIERSAARGFAPSSGLQELDLRDIERAADQARTVAGRDLAIAGLNRRDQDLSRALDLGQMLGLTIPQGQRREEIGLGNLLYQLPRTALNDALGVINGTPSSSDAFSQAIQLLQQQYGRQDVANQNNAALYGQIGQILAGLFG
jgi:hypothetical protein